MTEYNSILYVALRMYIIFGTLYFLRIKSVTRYSFEIKESERDFISFVLIESLLTNRNIIYVYWTNCSNTAVLITELNFQPLSLL